MQQVINYTGEKTTVDSSETFSFTALDATTDQLPDLEISPVSDSSLFSIQSCSIGFLSTDHHLPTIVVC